MIFISIIEGMIKRISFQAEAGYWDEYSRNMNEAGVGRGVNSNGLGCKSLLVAVLFRAVADLAHSEGHIRRTARGWFSEGDEGYVFSYPRICSELDFDAASFLKKLCALGLFPADGSKPSWKAHDLAGREINGLPNLFKIV